MAGIYFGFLFAPQHPKGAFGQGGHLVLTGVDLHRRYKLHLLRNPAHKRLIVRKAAGQKDRVHLAGVFGRELQAQRPEAEAPEAVELVDNRNGIIWQQ